MLFVCFEFDCSNEKTDHPTKILLKSARQRKYCKSTGETAAKQCVRVVAHATFYCLFRKLLKASNTDYENSNVLLGGQSRRVS